MAPTPGYQGQVKISSNVVAQVQSYTFDLDRAMEDVTVMQASPSPAKSFLPTVYQMGFQLKCLWDLTDTNGQLAIQNAWLNGTLLSFVITPNNGTNTYSFSAYVMKISIAEDVEKVVDSTIDLQPTGAVTFV
jgi:hypothetical protein